MSDGARFLMKLHRRLLRASNVTVAVGNLLLSVWMLSAADPMKGDARPVDLGHGVTLEIVYLPPGEFMMGSTPEERAWATGIEGGATPGTPRESYEGDGYVVVRDPSTEVVKRLLKTIIETMRVSYTG